MLARIGPGEQRRAGAADMEIAGRRGSEAGDDGLLGQSGHSGPWRWSGAVCSMARGDRKGGGLMAETLERERIRHGAGRRAPAPPADLCHRPRRQSRLCASRASLRASSAGARRAAAVHAAAVRDDRRADRGRSTCRSSRRPWLLAAGAVALMRWRLSLSLRSLAAVRAAGSGRGVLGRFLPACRFTARCSARRCWRARPTAPTRRGSTRSCARPQSEKRVDRFGDHADRHGPRGAGAPGAAS